MSESGEYFDLLQIADLVNAISFAKHNGSFQIASFRVNFTKVNSEQPSEVKNFGRLIHQAPK